MRRIAIELALWAIALSIVSFLPGCTGPSPEQETGTQSACVVAGKDNLCRDSNGIHHGTP